jgi:formylglycine-generating enzyme required for sulfatase activity
MIASRWLQTRVPEPGTLALLAAGIGGALSLTGYRLRYTALIAAIALLPAGLAKADVFHMPAGQTSVQFVAVGEPGNLPDTATGNIYGAVPYSYNIGKYDVTLGQYVQFLNAVAATDTYACYNANMAGSSGAFPFGIAQNGTPGTYSYSVTGANPQAANMPVYEESWGDAARFCNWLQNGQKTGAEGNGTTEIGSYLMSGATTDAALMAVASPAHSGSGAPQYFIPSENDWYKAAYYKSVGTNAGYWTYPTQSNSVPSNSLVLAGTNNNDANFYNNAYTDSTNYLTPVGTFVASPSPYGTFDQGGELWQWNETAVTSSSRGLRGGDFNDPYNDLASSGLADGGPTGHSIIIGFRVASSIVVPEPGSITLVLASGVCLPALAWRWRKQTS